MIQRNTTDSKEPSLSFESRRVLSFFLQCFKDPPIFPENPDLNFRVPIHESNDEEGSDTPPCSAIVVSQDKARYIYININSFHALFFKIKKHSDQRETIT